MCTYHKAEELVEERVRRPFSAVWKYPASGNHLPWLPYRWNVSSMVHMIIASFPGLHCYLSSCNRKRLGSGTEAAKLLSSIEPPYSTLNFHWQIRFQLFVHLFLTYLYLTVQSSPVLFSVQSGD